MENFLAKATTHIFHDFLADILIQLITVRRMSQFS